MPIKETPIDAPKSAEIPEALAEPAFNPASTPGFHVMHGDRLLGTYETEEAAEQFANAHPRNSGLEVEVIKGGSNA